MWDNEMLLKACKHQRQLEAKCKSYSKKRFSTLQSSCSSPGFVESEVGGEVLYDSVVSSPSSMDPGPSASQFTNFLGMAGVNKPTTLREVKEVVEEAVPNYLSVAAPPLVTAVTSGAPPTPGDRELTLVRQVGSVGEGRSPVGYTGLPHSPSAECIGFQGSGVPVQVTTDISLGGKFRANDSGLGDDIAPSPAKKAKRVAKDLTERIKRSQAECSSSDRGIVASLVHVTTQPHPPRCDGRQASATPPARERSAEVAAVQEEGNWAAQGSVAPWHPNVGELVRPHPPASRLDDDPDPLHQTCDPRHATHENLYQTSEEEEQHTVSELSDFLKLANFIYDQFGEAKGVRETRHDRVPGPGQEDFVLPQERDTFIPFCWLRPLTNSARLVDQWVADRLCDGNTAALPYTRRPKKKWYVVSDDDSKGKGAVVNPSLAHFLPRNASNIRPNISATDLLHLEEAVHGIREMQNFQFWI
ncbi:hypothetical protein E2C01_071496 [Portunus trituberculatus]|uniref:Uncharacterized protein n=1 Tax=Portunus trituberculatus TaxID=210409 RepID=A0A5B7I8C9_PORTR|nr:hypothetical protein [Portunus trituberculatus]